MACTLVTLFPTATHAGVNNTGTAGLLLLLCPALACLALPRPWPALAQARGCVVVVWVLGCVAAVWVCRCAAQR